MFSPLSAKEINQYLELITMNKIEAIEKNVRSLNLEELAKFRAWFAEYDAELWDEQIASAITNGKLDTLSSVALAEHKDGRSTIL
jgi:hypothetical protein